ncbi:MAG: hypothetical protein IKR97_00320 [Eubacterium sp.]|nr:hypothetical protein [Eubacterium sp.]
MTGLEKIISQIEYESDDRCRSVIDDAGIKANSIIKEAEEKAKAFLEESSAENAKKLENIRQSAVSSSELAKNKILLKSKLEIIDEMLEKALDEIRNLPEKEYFEILKGLILSNAKEGKGLLCLSQKDKSSLPENFLDEVNKSLEGGEIALGNTAPINGGFILIYGDIDINCSFDSIAASKRDELRDALNGILFN